MIGVRCEPVVLAKAPEDFDAVEFGGVGRQKQQRQPLRGPRRHLGLDQVGLVNRGVVKHEHGGLALMGHKLVDGEHKQLGRKGGGRNDGREGLAARGLRVGGPPKPQDRMAAAGPALGWQAHGWPRTCQA